MGFGNFGNQAPAAPAAGGFKRTAAPRPATPRPAARSRWAGVQSKSSRMPIIGVGRYLVRVVSNELIAPAKPGGHETFRAMVQIEACDGQCTDAVGDTRAIVETLGNTGLPGEGRTKSYVVAAAGYASDADYDYFDPDGGFLDAVMGEENDYAEAFPGTIVGRLVHVAVMRGNDVLDRTTKQPTGDYYREYQWSPVADGQVVPTPVMP